MAAASSDSESDDGAPPRAMVRYQYTPSSDDDDDDDEPPLKRGRHGLRPRSTPPSHRFSEVPARSGDEVGVGVALGVGRGAGESPATFFSPPPSSLQPMYLFPLKLPVPATAFGSEWFGTIATRGGASSPPFACPSRLIFSLVLRSTSARASARSHVRAPRNGFVSACLGAPYGAIVLVYKVIEYHHCRSAAYRISREYIDE